MNLGYAAPVSHPVTDKEMFDHMTKRERQAAALLIKSGYCDDRSIGEQMGICAEAVRRHITALLDQTGMGNRTELAVFLLRRPVLTALLDQVVIRRFVRSGI